MPLFAVGHSTRSEQAFLELLQAHGIEILVDIRTVPRSRHNPQFNADHLARVLPAHGIEYRHMKELGGLRHPQPDSANLGWENKSFRGFADYMASDEFRLALDELIRLGSGRRVAFMCAEGNPFRCHRTLVADALIARGQAVHHLASRRTAKPHRLTPFAQVQGELVTYPKRLAPVDEES